MDDCAEVLFDDYLVEATSTYEPILQPLEILDTVDVDPTLDWATCLTQMDDYAARQGIEPNEAIAIKEVKAV
jgi:hypothetical protein